MFLCRTIMLQSVFFLFFSFLFFSFLFFSLGGDADCASLCGRVLAWQVRDMFSDYGEVTNLNVNLDRKSGFVKGYAIIEYAEKEEAQSAIDEANGTDLLGQTVAVGWAFIKGKYASKSVANRGRAPPPRRD